MFGYTNKYIKRFGDHTATFISELYKNRVTKKRKCIQNFKGLMY